MKKSAKGSKSTKKSAPRKAAVKKPEAKAAAAKRPARPAPRPGSPPAAEARYTPAPLRADGWGPFRYPPQ
jgi:hypothetical protein